MTLFRLLEGRRPYQAEEVMAVVAGQALPEPRFQRLDRTSPVRRLLERVLVQDPARRPGGPASFRALLAGDEPSLPGGGLEVASAARLRPPEMAAPGRRRAAIAWGLAAVLGWLGWRWTRQDPAPRLEPARPQVVGPAGALQGPQSLRRLRRELEGVQLTARDRDPLRWEEAREKLPELQASLEVFAAGKRAVELSDELRAGLDELDALYWERGLPEPFRAYLEARPFPGTLAPEKDVWAGTPEERWRALKGWAAAGAEHLAVAGTLVEAMNQELRASPGGPYPGGVQALGLATRLTVEGFRAHFFTEEVFRNARDRRALRGWLRPVNRRMQACVLAFAESFRREPETRELLLELLVNRLGDVRVATLGAWARLPDALLLGGPPEEPAHLLLIGLVAERRARCLRRAGMDGTAAMARARAAFRQASERAPAGTPTRAHALRGRLILLLHDRRHREARAPAEALLGDLPELGEELGRNVLNELALLLQREGNVVELSPERYAQLVELFRGGDEDDQRRARELEEAP